MKNILLIILLLLNWNISNGQIKSTLEMAKELSKSNIEMETLKRYVTENISDPIKIAEFYYYWISLNIKYDYDKLEKIRANIVTGTELTDITTILNERKAVCIGFSTLYQEFLSSFNIKSEIISGYAKSPENPTLEPELDSDFMHAWNAIQINDDWILVDVTWANQFENNITDFYFNVSPDKLILTHYPNDNKWQLLDNPISLSDFNELPYIHSFYFQTGFPEKPILTSDAENYYFEFKRNPNRNWLVKLTYSIDNLNYESVFPEYIKNIDGFTYKFSKDKVPANSIIRIDLTDFNEEKQTMKSYEKIAFFNL